MMNRRQKLIQQQFLNSEEKVIKRLDAVYGQSLKDINGKIQNLSFTIGKLQQEYDWLDDLDPEKARIKSKIQSKIYQKQYQEQLQKQVEGILDKMQTSQFVTVSDYLDECYNDGFIGTIFDAHGQGVPFMAPINQEAMVRAVQLDSKISKGLYTRLGEDVALLKKKITAQVSRSIATGMTFSQTAKALEGYTKIGYNNAIRIARTEGHRIQTTATMDAMTEAKDRGADVVKQWDATLDGATRESHAAVDGQIRELNEKFSNGLSYPGDPSGSAAEVINCRCALLQRARWAVGNGFTKFNNFTKQVESFDSPADYDEFKKAFFSHENRSYMNFVKDMEEKYSTRDFPKLLDRMSDREYKQYSELLGKNPVYNTTSGLTKSAKNVIMQKVPYSGQTSKELEANLEASLSKMPASHRALAESKIKGIEITESEYGSSYHSGTQMVYVSKFAEPDEIIHEYAHAMGQALGSYQDPKFKKIMWKGFENITPADIIEDETTFVQPIYRIESSKFINEYQGRLYEDVGMYDGKNVSLDGMLDYLSVGYTEYIKNPANLKMHDPDLFSYFEGIK